jgi:hypothetical protein
VFCLQPGDARKSREWLLGCVADTDAPVSTAHFPATSAGRVRRDGDAFSWTYLDSMKRVTAVPPPHLQTKAPEERAGQWWTPRLAPHFRTGREFCTGAPVLGRVAVRAVLWGPRALSLDDAVRIMRREAAARIGAEVEFWDAAPHARR